VRIFMQLPKGDRNTERYTDDLKRVALDIFSSMKDEGSDFVLITKKKITEEQRKVISDTISSILTTIQK